MNFVDTHCHIHSSNYKLDSEEVYKRALTQGVTKMICVGTDVADSALASSFADTHDGVFASVGVHPHEAKNGIKGLEELLTNKKVVAVGEIGLDYFYKHSDREIQVKVFEQQLELAYQNKLPVIFHVREAFDDFWPILNNFGQVKGVVHSFTDTQKNLEEALSRGLFIGVNGISTFTKDIEQQEMFKHIPLKNLLLETDAPYLTPVSSRGKVNEPVFVREVAEYLSTAQSTSVDELALQTTHNATFLFHI